MRQLILTLTLAVELSSLSSQVMAVLQTLRDQSYHVVALRRQENHEEQTAASPRIDALNDRSRPSTRVRVSRRLARRQAFGCPPKASEATLCAYYEDAQMDVERRQAPGFSGWNGLNPSFSIRYQVKKSKGRGLGLFTAEPITKGSVVYTDTSENYIGLTPAMAEVVESVAKQFSVKSARRVSSWCFSHADFMCQDTGMICEWADGRYFNNGWNLSNVAACTGASDGRLCALRDIAAGEELLEDYTADELLNDMIDIPFIHYGVQTDSHGGCATYNYSDVAPREVVLRATNALKEP